MPSAVKTLKAVAASAVNAKPSAAPMNGAVHGAAISTASMPVRNQSNAGRRALQAASREGNRLPNSKTPDRFRASAKNSSASAATATGDWSWNPQPNSAPAERSASKATASAQKDTSTPAA